MIRPYRFLERKLYMIPDTLLLQRLLYMSPEIGLNFNLSTQHCFVFNSRSTLRSCNRVCHNAIPVHSEIVEIKSFFRNMRFTWFVDAFDIESQKILEENNLHYKVSFPGMILNLNTIETRDYGDEIIITRIDVSSFELEEWLNIVSQSFNITKSELLKVITLFSHLIVPDFLRLYLGFYKKKSVAACMVIQHKELVSLHWISTLSDYRNNGLGCAVTHKALFDAKNIGCKQAVLLSSTLGRRIYEYLGFQEYALYKVYGNY